MIKATEEQVLERLEAVPDSLRLALLNKTTGDIVWAIGHANSLPEEKIEILADLVGDILFGFSHYSDLGKDLRPALNLDPKIINTIVQEIDQKIFSRLRSDLKAAYDPLDGSLNKPKEGGPKTIALDRFGGAPAAPQRVPINVPVRLPETIRPASGPFGTSSSMPIKSSSPPPAPLKAVAEGEEKPLILHREDEAVRTEKKPSFHGFSLPFGFLKKTGGEEAKGPTRAVIETPGIFEKNKEQKKTVHYSEFRSEISPFNKPSGGAIDLNALGSVGSFPAIKPPKPEMEIPAAPKEPPPLKQNPPNRPDGPPPATLSELQKPKLKEDFSGGFFKKESGQVNPSAKPTVPSPVKPEGAGPQDARLVKDSPSAPGQPKIQGNMVDLR